MNKKESTIHPRGMNVLVEPLSREDLEEQKITSEKDKLFGRVIGVGEEVFHINKGEIVLYWSIRPNVIEQEGKIFHLFHFSSVYATIRGEEQETKRPTYEGFFGEE